jgi:preprotein translocase subunit SecD
MRGSVILSGLLVVLALAFAGCGGDGDDGETSSQESAELAIYDWEASLAPQRPFRSESDARAASGADAIVVRDESSPGDTRYFVVAGEPALTTADILDPETITDAATGEPAIAFQFTEDGKDKFQQLTRAVAQSGGHFAVVVDGELLSLPIVDAGENPNGIDGENGAQISGGFTVEEAQQLADGLEVGSGG